MTVWDWYTSHYRKIKLKIIDGYDKKKFRSFEKGGGFPVPDWSEYLCLLHVSETQPQALDSGKKIYLDTNNGVPVKWETKQKRNEAKHNEPKQNL